MTTCTSLRLRERVPGAFIQFFPNWTTIRILENMRLSSRRRSDGGLVDLVRYLFFRHLDGDKGVFDLIYVRFLRLQFVSFFGLFHFSSSTGDNFGSCDVLRSCVYHLFFVVLCSRGPQSAVKNSSDEEFLSWSFVVSFCALFSSTCV